MCTITLLAHVILTESRQGW